VTRRIAGDNSAVVDARSATWPGIRMMEPSLPTHERAAVYFDDLHEVANQHHSPAVAFGCVMTVSGCDSSWDPSG
jgi:hypothetical protein